MPDDFKHIGSHAEDLSDGRTVGPGQTVTLKADEQRDPHNKRLIEEGIFLRIEKPDNPVEPPTHEELLARAEELDIDGRHQMRNDQLQEAIIAAEAEGPADDEAGDDDDEEEDD